MFSIATHVCAAITYLFLPFFQPADRGDNDWAGIAMLVSVRRLAKSHELWLKFLKGGSFLYVGPALQPVREDETRTVFRLKRLCGGVYPADPQCGSLGTCPCVGPRNKRTLD